MRRALVLAAILVPGVAAAHPLDMAAVRVAPSDDGVDVRFDADLGAAGAVALEPTGPCREVRRVDVGAGLDLRVRATWDCGPAGVSAAQGRLAGADARGLDAILVVHEGDRTTTQVLRGEAWSVATPAPRSFVRAGAEHIAAGVDHLLFVALLLVLVSGSGALIATVTAFTVGHSLTLAAVALGAPAPAAAPTEALIAASVLLAAWEASRDASSRGLFGRRPAVGALLFGLLHGLGFAGALGAAGLPEGARAAALFGFNVGVELGQLAFVGLCFVAARATSINLRRPLVYVAGSAGAFLLLDRLAQLG